MSNIEVKSFYDKQTGTLSHIVYETKTMCCAIVDSVLSYELVSAKTNSSLADELIDFVKSQNLKLEYILETHVHADHISAACYIKSQLGGKVVIGEKIQQVQQVFKPIFNFNKEIDDLSYFDYFIKDNEVLKLGDIEIKALSVPGHTPACMAYCLSGMVFVGDTLFSPDLGTARCDFPGGSAEILYQSVQKILSMDESTKLYLCHDYPPETREVKFFTTVAEQKNNNIHINSNNTKDEFLTMRTTRDKTLLLPKLFIPSIQLNIKAGQIPAKEDNGISYIKFPLNQF